MKRVDIFCKSQAATSICLSMEHNSTSSPSSATLLGGGGAAIDRHNPIIKDSRRNPKPTASHPPTTSKPQKPHTKKKKNSRNIPSTENENDQSIKTDTFSLSELDDDKTRATSNDVTAAIVKKSWSCTKPGDFLSPPGSTRFLLREKAQYSTLSDSDSTKLSVEESSNKDVKIEEPAPTDSSEQVVVLRVSLHCRGCERKLRKHLSRMEGVTSFNIDFAAKKVTVVGNVTPLDVVSSISKVKNAQLWSPSISSSNPTSEIKNCDSEIDLQTEGAV